MLKAGTTQRVAYATTAAQGMTVFDGRRTVARREMEARDEIKELIMVLNRTPERQRSCSGPRGCSGDPAAWPWNCTSD